MTQTQTDWMPAAVGSTHIHPDGSKWIRAVSAEFRPLGKGSHPGMIIADVPGHGLMPAPPAEEPSMREIAQDLAVIGLGPDEPTEEGLYMLIRVAADRELAEDWVFAELNNRGAVCGRDSKGELFILALEWEQYHAVADLLNSTPRVESKKKTPVGGNCKKHWEALTTSERDAIIAEVHTAKTQLMQNYSSEIDEPTLFALWGGVAHVSDGKVTWVRLQEFERKVKEEALVRQNAKLAQEVGVTLNRCLDCIMERHSLCSKCDCCLAEEVVTEQEAQTLDAEVVHNTSAQIEDDKPTNHVQNVSTSPEEVETIEIAQTGEQLQPPYELPSPAVKETMTPEHVQLLESLYTEGVACGITEKLLKIWWQDILRTSRNLQVIHDLQELRTKIYAFRYAQHQVPETKLNEDGTVDINGLLLSFGWTEMPKLTDPDIYQKLDAIGDRVATLKEAAARFRTNAEVKAKEKLASASQYEAAFGHLLSSDAQSRLKRTKSGKDPGKITGGKTVTYDSFAVSFEKTGGLCFSKNKTGESLAPLLLALGEDQLRLLKEIGFTLETKTSYDFGTNELREAIKQNIFSVDDLDGVTDLPVNECGKWEILPTKKGA